ncbi:MAG: DUF1704 domain-containing protein, partial [Saprospiraceae bacterium]|nr:DUF1704 domain-containing protein [Saprospiraceae bacterium]
MLSADAKRIVEISDALYNASRPIRILRNISWPRQVRDQFFASGAERLPQVSYPQFDPTESLQHTEHARQLARGTGLVERWALRVADVLEHSARMLAGMGTPDFYKYSARLYGTPGEPLADGTSTSLALARQFDELYARVGNFDLGAPPEACHLAWTIADQMREAVNEMFGDDAPEVVLDDDMASNAIAGRRRIRIRRTACFSDNDYDQLIHHEAYIHVATSINAYAQPHLKILRAGHPGTTRTQEGLAVFAEFITGSLDLDRLRRLSDRIIAIQMSLDGADFVELYRYFLQRTDNPEQAFDNARRVVRGGVASGGAPFTKDMVYLDGLLHVHNYLRVMV